MPVHSMVAVAVALAPTPAMVRVGADDCGAPLPVHSRAVTAPEPVRAAVSEALVTLP